MYTAKPNASPKQQQRIFFSFSQRRYGRVRDDAVAFSFIRLMRRRRRDVMVTHPQNSRRDTGDSYSIVPNQLLFCFTIYRLRKPRSLYVRNTFFFQLCNIYLSTCADVYAGASRYMYMCAFKAMIAHRVQPLSNGKALPHPNRQIHIAYSV